MGSGLIFAGLGKGISDAGATYGNMMFKAAEAELADQRALQRAEALERLKEEREEAKLKRDADIYTQAQANALLAGETRRSAQLDKDASALSANAQNIAGESPAATPEQMRQHLERLTPAERKAIEGTGLISGELSKTRQEMQGYEDVVSEARKLGGSATLVKSLQEAKKERLAEIKAELAEKKEDRRYELDQAKEERRAEEFKALLPVRQQTADAATTRAARAGSGGGSGGGAPKVRSTYTDDQGNRVAVMNDGSTKVLGRGGDFDKSVANLVSRMSKDDPFNFGKLPESEKRAQAIERLTGGAQPPRSDNRSAAPASRPPLSSFAR